MLQNFLRKDWKSDINQFPLIPAETMRKLESVLNELANILEEDNAPQYMPLIGDMRKLKRFVNASLMMQIEKVDLDKTDFNAQDLINLLFLHLNYPGLFRRVYLEETEGRKGTFSVMRCFTNQELTFSNTKEFITIVGECDQTSKFLLNKLFDVNKLGLEQDHRNERILRSRACFNDNQYRNLEKYLNLIVRFVVPEPQDTFKMFQNSVDRVKQGCPVASILEEPHFNLQKTPFTHLKFWDVLVSQSYELKPISADDAINTLIEYLPRYPFIYSEKGVLRKSIIYNLIYLLDRVGWDRSKGLNLYNTPENVIEIVRRIFGEGRHEGKGLLNILTTQERGVLGWYDLMLFRLHCSADLQSQTQNITRALILHDDITAQTTGLVSLLAKNGMRTFSQRVFQLFREKYIDQRRNFLTDVDDTPEHEFYGDTESWFKEQNKNDDGLIKFVDQLLATRSAVKSFVFYQLSNQDIQNGRGICCGFYDETGLGDSAGISKIMNKYIFEICFDPSISEDNLFHFTDHCLRSLSSSYFVGGNDEAGYIPTEIGLLEGLDPEELKKYWIKFGQRVKDLSLLNKRVVTLNYIATYSKDLPKVFEVLDKMTNILD